MTNLQKAAEPGNQAAPNLLDAIKAGEVGGGGGAMTQKVMFMSQPESDGVENPVSFEQTITKLFSDFPVVLAESLGAENNIIAFSFNNNSIKDDCLAYFGMAYENLGPEGEAALEALEAMLSALEPNVIYTSENIPVIDSDEEPTLDIFTEMLFYGLGFSRTPFTLTPLEGFKMRHVPLNTEGGTIIATPCYNYNTSSEQLSLCYEAFSQM